ncbi:hypothetical protein [Geodermatophilus sabuli]|uniref:Uncharacterized protein n=1 Tax=Geodermatophilus sabuli TaxID=1564158 RepID=A0A285EE04_9ACTN|nr:hypothetical protein [Geodermatophilus sabuli]MBB3084575.1 hypothetical protein [Geodermatophilus sabuli]SNX97230.1 hypothetical protein SAMN06893097_106180 [Geodermatophilus sabuli]
MIAEETLDDAVVATNRVLHGPEHLSRLILPIIRPVRVARPARAVTAPKS